MRIVQRLLLLVFLSLITSGLSASQSARFVTGEQLFALLSASDVEQKAVAKFYVLGVIDTASLLRDPKICVTPETESSLLTEKLLKFLILQFLIVDHSTDFMHFLLKRVLRRISVVMIRTSASGLSLQSPVSRPMDVFGKRFRIS